MRCLAAILAVLCFTLCGCGGSNREENFGCTASVEPGIVVEVTDATSGASVAEGATVVITDDEYSETLHGQSVTLNPDGTYTVVSFGGAMERPGTYTLRVTRSGYSPAERTGIQVTRNECHVNTQKISIALTPTMVP